MVERPASGREKLVETRSTPRPSASLWKSRPAAQSDPRHDDGFGMSKDDASLSGTPRDQQDPRAEDSPPSRRWAFAAKRCRARQRQPIHAHDAGTRQRFAERYQITYTGRKILEVKAAGHRRAPRRGAALFLQPCRPAGNFLYAVRKPSAPTFNII